MFESKIFSTLFGIQPILIFFYSLINTIIGFFQLCSAPLIISIFTYSSSSVVFSLLFAFFPCCTQEYTSMPNCVCSLVSVRILENECEFDYSFIQLFVDRFTHFDHYLSTVALVSAEKTR